MGFIGDILVGKGSGKKKPWGLRGYSSAKKLRKATEL